VAPGSGTILLVEDEAEVRSLLVEVLEGQGYRVLAARDGREALTAARAFPGRIALLLTDVVMPGLSGREVAEQVTSLHPEARVLYMSGYTDDEIVRRGVARETMAILHKPFTPAVVALRVREVLDPAPAA
jgi:CheY-like chemotaxis protein